MVSINRKSCGGHLGTPNSWFSGFIFAVGWVIQYYSDQCLGLSFCTHFHLRGLACNSWMNHLSCCCRGCYLHAVSFMQVPPRDISTVIFIMSVTVVLHWTACGDQHKIMHLRYATPCTAAPRSNILCTDIVHATSHSRTDCMIVQSLFILIYPQEKLRLVRSFAFTRPELILEYQRIIIIFFVFNRIFNRNLPLFKLTAMIRSSQAASRNGQI